MTTELARRLLAWYEGNARRLPWRDNQNPYRTWISEIMLQQTRVEAVIPYFERWLARFPSLADLAAASEQDVLRAWEGLGYYSRARNLHKAARLVMDQFGGALPAERAALQSLPGIGRYTAGAIASIAFGLDEPALDGNIRRVLARVFDVTVPARSPKGERILWALAEENLPAGRAGDYNQALMDLGASICTPRSPACLACPLNGLCRAFALGVQEQRPVKLPKRQTPHYLVTAAVIRQDGKLLLAQRPSEGLLGGLWEFPGGKVEPGESLPQCLRREIVEELGAEIEVGEPFGVYEHAYTHFSVTLHAFLCRLLPGEEPQPIQPSDLCWAAPDDLRDFPMGKIDRQIAKRIESREQPGPSSPEPGF